MKNKRYHILSFKDFEKEPNIWSDEGGPYTLEEVKREIHNVEAGEKYPDIRVIDVEDKFFGIAEDDISEKLSDYMKDNVYDEVCSPYDMDSEFYDGDIDQAFEDEEVKTKIEELATLINTKADIKYYVFKPWEAVKLEEIKEDK